jgi:hypothetical protein
MGHYHRCTEKDKDLSEETRVDMGAIERYCDITEGVRDIMGTRRETWP